MTAVNRNRMTHILEPNMRATLRGIRRRVNLVGEVVDNRDDTPNYSTASSASQQERQAVFDPLLDAQARRIASEVPPSQQGAVTRGTSQKSSVNSRQSEFTRRRWERLEKFLTQGGDGQSGSTTRLTPKQKQLEGFLLEN
jgi:hypothetical protein